MSDKKTRRRRYKLRNLEVDRVDLVDTGANQHAHVVIAKNKDKGYAVDRIEAADLLRRRKKKKGTALPDEVAAEVSAGYSKHAAPTHPGTGSDQSVHGGGGGGGKGGSKGERSLKRVRIEDRDNNIFSGEDSSGNRVKFRSSPEDAKALRSAMFSDLPFSGVSVDESEILSGDDNYLADPPSTKKVPYVSPTSFDDGGKGDGDNYLADPAPSGPRPLHEIAREIRRDWGSKVNYGAVPYLDAMGSLDKITDNYYMDSGDSIVAYFLSNATTWRGETAKRVKAELREMLKQKKVRKADAPEAPKPQQTTSSLQSLLQQALAMVSGGGDDKGVTEQTPPPRKELADFMRRRQAAAPSFPAASPAGVGGGPAAPGALPGQPGQLPPVPGGNPPGPGQPLANPQPGVPKTSGELAEMLERRKAGSKPFGKSE